MSVTMFNDVRYEVDDYNVLTAMSGSVDKVFIPSVLPNGQKISVLGNHFCTGIFSEVVIDDSISYVDNFAFAHSWVDVIVWPSSCKFIPRGCFFGSHVKDLRNIDHVTSIGECAFLGTYIEEMRWPSGCEEIPVGCFSDASLKSISNVQHVKKIGNRAFSCTWIEKFEWPENCSVVPEKCFKECRQLKSLDMPDTVTKIGVEAFGSTSISSFTWPSACAVVPMLCFSMSSLREIHNIQNISCIESDAFKGSLLGALDLSCSPLTELKDDSLAGIGKEAVVLPYYMSEDAISRAF